MTKKRWCHIFVFISALLEANIQGARRDHCMKVDGLCVRNDAVISCDERVGGTLCVEGAVRYGTCSGGLFPAASCDGCATSVRGGLCFSTGGMRAPGNIEDFIITGSFFTLPLFILSLKTGITQGCGFSLRDTLLQSKLVGIFDSGEYLIPVELATRVEFCKPFCEPPVVTVQYDTSDNQSLLSCTTQELNVPVFSERYSAVWLNTQVTAADVSRCGFTLSVIFYISAAMQTPDINPVSLLKLNEFINQLINKSEVSFVAEGACDKGIRTVCVQKE